MFTQTNFVLIIHKSDCLIYLQKKLQETSVRIWPNFVSHQLQTLPASMAVIVLIFQEGLSVYVDQVLMGQSKLVLVFFNIFTPNGCIKLLFVYNVMDVWCSWSQGQNLKIWGSVSTQWSWKKIW